MNLSNTIYYIFAVLFVLAATVIGCFLAPFIVWCTSADLLYVLFGISCAFLLLGIILCIARRRKNLLFFKIALPIVIAVFLSTLITSIDFGFTSAKSCRNYIKCGDNSGRLFSKVGTEVLNGRYAYWGWGYDDGQVILINYSSSERDREGDYYYYCRDIYDTELNLIKAHDHCYLGKSRYLSDIRDHLKEDYEIMEW